MKSVRHLSLFVSASLYASTLLYAPAVSAAPGILSEKPLSLVITTKPNILLLLDDSGSMNSDAVITTEASQIHDVTVGNSNTLIKRTSAQNNRELLGLCNGYNSLAFNPNVNYVKWQDYAGKTFIDYATADTFDIKNVIDQPFLASSTSDLSEDFYIRWRDDGDGIYNNVFLTAEGDFDYGECGSGVGAYDAALNEASDVGVIVNMPTSGVDNTSYNDPDVDYGTFTDSNAIGSNNYSPGESGVLVVNVPDGGEDGVLTFDVTLFNVDRSGGDTDSLTVYGGNNATSLASPNLVANAIKVTGEYDSSGESVPVVLNTSEEYRTPSAPYVFSEPQTTSALTFSDDSSSNRLREVSQFQVKGNSATFVFDGGSNTGTREGFIISWRHSSFEGNVPDGIVNLDDCVDNERLNLNCVKISDLPESEAEATLLGLPPYNTKRNYANWFTYYRTRLPVAQKALARVVYNSDYRMGFTTLNDTGYGGSLIQDVEDEADGSMSAAKKDLMEKIYAIRTVPKVDGTDSDGNSIKVYADGTQLIKALSNAGRYFTEGTDPESDFFGSTADSIPISSSHEEDNDSTVDKSPVFTNDYGGECQQNFTLLFTDGAWGDDVSDYLNTDHDVNDTAEGFVGDYDKSGDFAGGVYADQGVGIIDTLADVSMYYFANDLAPSVRDSLSIELHGDIISHQHMVTFGVGFGVNGSVTSTPSNFDATTSVWPAGTSAAGLPPTLTTSSDKIDDLHHATFNGRGAYVSASNTETLETELDKIISEIGERVSNTASGASFSSFRLLDGEFRFDTSYETATWSGDLEAFAYSSQTNSFADSPAWSAQSKMALRSDRHDVSSSSGRNIITYNGSKGIPFQFSFPSNYTDAGSVDAMSETQVADLLTLAPYTTITPIPNTTDVDEIAKNQAYGEVLVSYLRGNGSNDGLSLEGAAALNGSRVASGTAGSTSFDSGYVFRDRDERYIGSLIHSQPEFVGAASNSYPDNIESDADLYSTFVETINDRRPMLYVGGNDGMLHGFYAKNKIAPDASGGEEVFAYIPSMVSDTDNGGQGLHQLSLPSYEGLAYVDGSPNVSDVFVNRSASNNFEAAFEEAQWRTYLVGGLRSGGKGLYVLDVTNPDNDSSIITSPRLNNAEDSVTAEKIVVREFTHEKLGHIYGRPQIGRMNNGRWAAIVGNGYNSSSTEAGTASLFVVYLDAPTETSIDPDTGIVSYQLTDTDGDGILNNGNGDYSIITASSGSWIKCADQGDECVLAADVQVRYGANGNYNYRTEPFEAGTYTCSNDLLGASTEGNPVCEYSDSNGLSQPEIVDLDGNGSIDRVYAGDLHGNMWVFDITANAPNNWKLHNDDSKPLFTACATALNGNVCAYDQRQPITAKPLVRNNPIRNSDSTEPNKLVFFGAGQYLTNSDPSSSVEQSFYTVWDAGAVSSGLSKENLTIQYIDNSEDYETRTMRISTVSYNTSNTAGFGWYYENLPGGGLENSGAERVILRPLLFANILFFQTLIPNPGLCNVNAGSGYIMAVDPLTGGNPPIDVFNQGGDANVAGVKVGDFLLGSNVTVSDEGIEVTTKTTGNENITTTISSGSSGSTDEGQLFKNKGRKSWSILR